MDVTCAFYATGFCASPPDWHVGKTKSETCLFQTQINHYSSIAVTHFRFKVQVNEDLNVKVQKLSGSRAARAGPSPYDEEDTRRADAPEALVARLNAFG